MNGAGPAASPGRPRAKVVIDPAAAMPARLAKR